MLAQRAEVQSEISVSDASSAVSSAPALVKAPGVEVVDRLRSAWELLPARTPMQLFIWARACAEAFTRGTVKLVTAGDANPQAIAALFRPTGEHELVPLGAGLYEQADFPCADDEAAAELAEKVAALRTSTYFNDLSANSVFLRELRRVCGSRLIATPRPGHPWIDLDDSWLEPESHLNSGRRSDLRRARRNAEKLGRVTVEMITPQPACVDSLLNEAFRVEAANWKGREGSALAVDSQVGTFYRRFAAATSERGMLRIGMLRINGQAVATQLALKMDEAFWLFKMGYDETFGRCSPGQLLMVESLRYARQQGCSLYELTGQSEPWNHIWTQQLHPAVRVRVHAAGVRGWVSVASDLVREAARNLVRHKKRESK